MTQDEKLDAILSQQATILNALADIGERVTRVESRLLEEADRLGGRVQRIETRTRSTRPPRSAGGRK